MNNNTKQKPKIRAAIYLRVSTDEQSKEGYGMAYQEEKVKSFITSQDYLLDEKSHIFKDEGFSGTLPIEERPALKSLFEAAERREFDVVLVYRLDRFFRKIILLLSAVEKLTEYNIGFRSTTEPFDTSSHFGRYILASLGALAELERDVIKERMYNGRTMAAKSGKYVLGQAPYGYKIDKKTSKLKIVPEEAKWVKKIFEWLVDEQVPLTAITRRINELKIPTPYQVRKSKRKTSGFWHKRTINRILTNEVYGGIFYFRKYKKRGEFRPQEEWIEIPTPVIVAPEMIELAQLQLNKNREFASRKSKLLYLFAKLVYCNKCGFKLFGAFHPPVKKDNKGSKYYRGIHKSSSAMRYVMNSQRCDWCGEIAENRLEPIWEAIKSLLDSPEYTFNKLQKYMDRNVDKNKTKERLKEIDKEFSGIEEKRRRVDVLYSETRRIDYAEYRRRLSDYDKDEESLSKEKIQLIKLLENKNYRKDRIKSLEALQEKVKKSLENPSYEDKYKIIHLLVNRITLFLNNNEAEVELNLLPVYENGIKLEDVLRPQIQAEPQFDVLQDNRRRRSSKMDKPFF